MPITTPTGVQEAAHRVYVAALRRAYSEEACGGRETAGDSASLDFAHDEWAEVLDAYVAARNAAALGSEPTGFITLQGDPR